MARSFQRWLHEHYRRYSILSQPDIMMQAPFGMKRYRACARVAPRLPACAQPRVSRACTACYTQQGPRRPHRQQQVVHLIDEPRLAFSSSRSHGSRAAPRDPTTRITAWASAKVKRLRTWPSYRPHSPSPWEFYRLPFQPSRVPGSMVRARAKCNIAPIYNRP